MVSTWRKMDKVDFESWKTKSYTYNCKTLNWWRHRNYRPYKKRAIRSKSDLWTFDGAATFKSFFHQSYKSTPLLFLCHCFLINFMTQTLNNNFWVLHKNKSRAFPLKTSTLAYVNFTETFLFLNQIQPYKSQL